MNLFSVNGGLLNGGYSSALVAASAAAVCSSLVASVAVRAQEALSAVYSEAKITASAALHKSAGAALVCASDAVATSKRELRPHAAYSGTAGVVVDTRVNHGSTAAAQGTAELTANATKKATGAFSAQVSADLNPVALKTAKPGAAVSAGSDISAVAQRSAFASLTYGAASCAFNATPDAAVGERGASFNAGATLQITPSITRYGVAALWCGVDVASIPVRVAEPTAIATTDVDFATHPYVTAGGAAAAQVASLVNAEPYVVCYGSCAVLVDANFEVVGNSSTADPLGFDPANRTFYRQKTATSFSRSASITEFRRQA